MKRLLPLLPLLTSFFGFQPGAVASERAETLRAINQVENPTNHTRPGAKGELGPYQFRRDTWRQHTRKPFTMANDRTTADEVASAHYEWLKGQLNQAGVAPSTFNIAMAWNCGINAVLSGRIPTVSYHYAERVTNLVESAQRQREIEKRVASSMVVVRTLPEKTQPKAMLTFRVDVPAQPRFTLPPEGPQFKVPGQTQRFVLTTSVPMPEATGTRFAFAF